MKKFKNEKGASKSLCARDFILKSFNFLCQEVTKIIFDQKKRALNTAPLSD